MSVAVRAGKVPVSVACTVNARNNAFTSFIYFTSLARLSIYVSEPTHSLFLIDVMNQNQALSFLFIMF
jgi:hypothetical protein